MLCYLNHNAMLFYSQFYAMFNHNAMKFYTQYYVILIPANTLRETDVVFKRDYNSYHSFGNEMCA